MERIFQSVNRNILNFEFNVVENHNFSCESNGILRLQNEKPELSINLQRFSNCFPRKPNSIPISLIGQLSIV